MLQALRTSESTISRAVWHVLRGQDPGLDEDSLSSLRVRIDHVACAGRLFYLAHFASFCVYHLPTASLPWHAFLAPASIRYSVAATAMLQPIQIPVDYVREKSLRPACHLTSGPRLFSGLLMICCCCISHSFLRLCTLLQVEMPYRSSFEVFS